MSERIKAFRERLYSKDARARFQINLKDMITVSLSVLAVGLSVSTFYLNVLREVDDIGVLIEPPAVDQTKNDFRLKGGLGLNFVNAGNRSAIVANIDIIISDIGDIRSGDFSCADNEKCIGTNAGHILVKKDDVLPINTLLQERQNFINYLNAEKDGGFVIARYDVENLKKFQPKQVSARFAVITPSGRFEKTVELMSIILSNGVIGLKSNLANKDGLVKVVRIHYERSR
jgi:hypothetical protein